MDLQILTGHMTDEMTGQMTSHVGPTAASRVRVTNTGYAALLSEYGALRLEYRQAAICRQAPMAPSRGPSKPQAATCWSNHWSNCWSNRVLPRCALVHWQPMRCSTDAAKRIESRMGKWLHRSKCHAPWGSSDPRGMERMCNEAPTDKGGALQRHKNEWQSRRAGGTLSFRHSPHQSEEGLNRCSRS